MIGFLVDIGYSYIAPDRLSSIDEVTFLDLNRYFVFPSISIDQINNEILSAPTSDMIKKYNELKSMIGQEADLLYGHKLLYASGELIPTNGVYYLNLAFPSIVKMFPVFNNSKFPIDNPRWTVIYFKKLNKILVQDREGTSTYICLVNNGAIEYLKTSGTTDDRLGTYRYSGMTGLPCYDPNIGGYNNVSAWSVLNIGVGYTATPVTISARVSPITSSSRLFNLMQQLLYTNGVPSSPDIEGDVIPPDNPYEPVGPSGPTDPDLPPGTFDDESDPIPDSPLPTLSAANTGFTRIYNPTLSQVQALARYLWTDDSVIETIWNHIKQFFENPMEAIIGFNLVPVHVPDGGTENFALMYIDTGVPMTVAANQFVDLDCGSVELKRYYGSALDQSPYTKVSCFLPYIGTVNLNTDEVIGTTLQIKYRVDIVSGSCVAKIFVDGNCLYQYSGHCAITIPFSSADFSSYVSAAISVGKLAAAAITAGAGAAMAAGVPEASQQTNQVVTTTQVTNTARNPSTGRQVTTGTTTTVQTRESPADQSSTQASFSGLSPQNVANTVGAIMSSKPHIEHSGSFSGNSGYLGVRRPFLIIERPNMCMPANYQALNGFPAMITMELSTCKGFTRVQQVQLTGMGRATNPEQAEILELLKSGVVL